MSESTGMTYARWKGTAAARGWHIPPRQAPLAEEWMRAWVRYWVAMDEYERRIAAGDPDPGRPVVPHRTGRGT